MIGDENDTPPSGRVRLDATSRAVLAHCSGCPSFRDMRSNLAAAHLAAASHAELVHGDANAAKEHRRRARHTQNGG